MLSRNFLYMHLSGMFYCTSLDHVGCSASFLRRTKLDSGLSDLHYLKDRNFDDEAQITSYEQSAASCRSGQHFEGSRSSS